MIWRNPIFIRFCRSELRVKKAIFWYLLTFIATSFAVSLCVLLQPTAYDGARVALPIILGIQGVIMLFLGTGKMAVGITREKVDNVLDYQRLTPLPVRDKILGYLFGLPVKYYAMFIITVPFLIYVLIVGRIPPSVFIPYYLIFFTSTLLYHFTGMVAGMVSRHWWLSAIISMGLILLLYLVLPGLSHIGLVFLEFLTVRPAFAEYIIPIISPNEDVYGLLAGNRVPFFTISITGTLFSFILQAGLILLFGTIISRKWKSDAIPAISKWMALTIVSVFAIMSLANLWPNLTKADNALQLFNSGGDLEAMVIVFALPFILAVTTTYLACALMLSALPDPMQFRHGRIRAKRHLQTHLSRWEDAEGGYLMTGLIYLLQIVLFATIYFTMNKAGYFEDLNTHPISGLWVLLATGLSLFYFQGLKENFGTGPIALFVLVGWTVPILAAILVVASNQEMAELGLSVAALSPISIILLAITQTLPPEFTDGYAIAFQRALGVSILLMTGMNIWLHLRLRRWRNKVN